MHLLHTRSLSRCPEWYSSCTSLISTALRIFSWQRSIIEEGTEERELPVTEVSNVANGKQNGSTEEVNRGAHRNVNLLKPLREPLLT